MPEVTVVDFIEIDIVSCGRGSGRAAETKEPRRPSTVERSVD